MKGGDTTKEGVQRGRNEEIRSRGGENSQLREVSMKGSNGGAGRGGEEWV